MGHNIYIIFLRGGKQEIIDFLIRNCTNEDIINNNSKNN